MKEHTLRCSLTGDVWKKGYTVTYLLTIGEVADGYYFVAEAPAENPHSDVIENRSFALHSYRMYVDKENNLDITTRGVNWKVAGYYSDAACTKAFDGSEATNAPSWLPYSVTGNSSGTAGVYVGGNGGTASYSISAQSPTKIGNHETNLKSNTDQGGVASSLDLSQKDPNGVDYANPETANCYIVNRRGSYTFPLVYGNKTTGTTENPVAEADYFVDHTGTKISYSKIENQIKAKNPTAGTYEKIDETHRKRTEYTWNITTGVNADPVSLRAILVWQDVSGLISNVNIPSGAENLDFNVEHSTPGNAVVALQVRKVTTYQKEDSKDNWVLDTSQGTSGYDVGAWETAWTWHIWMTDEVYPNYTSPSATTNVNTQYLNNNPSYGSGNYIGSHTVALKNWGTNGSNGTSKTILPVNLGWVPQEMNFKYYSKREVWVKLQQVEPAEGGRTAVVHIVQHAKQPLVRGQGTFYQWGRPTALPGYNYTDDAKTKRDIYRNSEVFPEFTVENISNPQDAIVQPTKLLRQEDKMATWFSGDNPYWGETKTVYDPCPPGYKVPDYNIFTGVSLTGATVTKGDKLNMWEDAGANFYGGYFFVEPHTSREVLDRYDQTVYFPATGQYQAVRGAGSELWVSTSPNNNFIEAMPGTLWSNKLKGDGEHGSALNLFPDISREHSSKPPVELPRAVNLSTACAIRPVAK